MAKFYNIDPETCTKEELESAIIDCEKKEEFYNNAQLSTKIAINSIYGVFGSSYYSLHSTDIAESITLQGQDLIKYSVNKIDEYFKNIWPSDISAHKKVAEYMKGKFPDFDVDKFLEFTKRNINIGETSEIYGDSVTGDSVIQLDNEEITIEHLFESGYNLKEYNGKEYVLVNKSAITFYNGTKKTFPIKYVMRHKVNKNKWLIETSNGHSVCTTEDHSIMVIKNNLSSLVEVSPKDINIGDTLITIDDSKIKESVVNQCKCVGTFNNEYVYDIEIDTDNSNAHTFFANGILVHNTDSIHSSSIIRTEKHPTGISIKDLYNENKNNVGPSTKAGHESVFTDDKVLNFINDTKNFNFSRVKRLIRHKVNKPAYKIRTKAGKEIICTGDHSIMVLRDGLRIAVKPTDIRKTDTLITIK